MHMKMSAWNAWRIIIPASFALILIFSLDMKNKLTVPHSVFTSMGEASDLCLRDSNDNDCWHYKEIVCNIVFIKIPKCASSTNGGIARRIARKFNLSGVHETDSKKFLDSSLCRVHANHKSARKLNGVVFDDGKKRFNTLAYTFIRDPAKRAVSQYFHFKVSRHGAGITDDKVIKAIKGTKNFITNYINFSANKSVDIDDVSDILNVYDFVGIVERQDECLVVMKLLWGLDYKDILYLSSKSSGAYDDRGFYIYPSMISPKTERFLKEDFIVRNTLDYLLYQEAERKLDATINAFGIYFHKSLSVFQKLKARADSLCSSSPPFDPYSGEPNQDSERDCFVVIRNTFNTQYPS